MKTGNSPARLRAFELFIRMYKHQFSRPSSAPIFLESGCGRSVFVCRLQWPCRPVPLASVSDSSVVLLGLLWGLAGYWQHSSMGQRWQFSSCTLRFNPLWLLWLKVAQTGDYTSATAGEEVTHHTVQIRLNKHSLGWAVWTWRSVSPSPVWAGLGGWNRRLEQLESSHRKLFKQQSALACPLQLSWQDAGVSLKIMKMIVFLQTVLSGSLDSEFSARLVHVSGEDTDLVGGSWNRNLVTKYEDLISM